MGWTISIFFLVHHYRPFFRDLIIKALADVPWKWSGKKSSNRQPTHRWHSWAFNHSADPTTADKSYMRFLLARLARDRSWRYFPLSFNSISIGLGSILRFVHKLGIHDASWCHDHVFLTQAYTVSLSSSICFTLLVVAMVLDSYMWFFPRACCWWGGWGGANARGGHWWGIDGIVGHYELGSWHDPSSECLEVSTIAGNKSKSLQTPA